MQMGRGCMALMPREPGTVGTATCTLCLLESAVQRGMGRGREEEEEEEEEEPQKAWIQAQFSKKRLGTRLSRRSTSV